MTPEENFLRCLDAWHAVWAEVDMARSVENMVVPAARQLFASEGGVSEAWFDRAERWIWQSHSALTRIEEEGPTATDPRAMDWFFVLGMAEAALAADVDHGGRFAAVVALKLRRLLGRPVRGSDKWHYGRSAQGDSARIKVCRRNLPRPKGDLILHVYLRGIRHWAPDKWFGWLASKCLLEGKIKQWRLIEEGWEDQMHLQYEIEEGLVQAQIWEDGGFQFHKLPKHEYHYPFLPRPTEDGPLTYLAKKS